MDQCFWWSTQNYSPEGTMIGPRERTVIRSRFGRNAPLKSKIEKTSCRENRRIKTRKTSVDESVRS